MFFSGGKDQSEVSANLSSGPVWGEHYTRRWRIPLSVTKFSFSQLDWALALGPLGACGYIAGAALPFKWDIPLVVLALSGGLVAFFNRRNRPPDSSPLLFPVLIFLLVTGLSILVSKDIGRSVRSSVALVPAVLLFFLIADHFHGPRHTRLLYLTFSAVGLGLALAVLWNAWRKGWVIPQGFQNWISDVPSPILVVPNDTAFLAVVAPLSLALLCCEARNAVRVFSALSIFLSVCAVCVIQSRVAFLTIISSLACAAAFLRPRLALPFGLVILTATLLVDGLLGFPLATKFGLIWDAGSGGLWDARIPIWSAAWAAFLNAPLWGQGLHTFDYTSPDSIRVTWVHNLYLETLAEQGIIGLTALGFLLFGGLSTALNIKRAELTETRILGAGALAALIGLCLAAFFELSFLRQWVVIILFALLGVIAQLESYKQRVEWKA